MIDDLIAGHHEFRRTYVAGEREYLTELARSGQRPGALYIGCADSRVVPELLTGSAPGDLFVVRNVANLAPRLDHSDASVGAAIEYSVDHLEVQHVIVCGHYGCGGVAAVLDGHLDGGRFPSLREWLAEVEPAVARARQALPGGEREALWRRAVEENVLEQLANLTSFKQVEEALAAGRLHLHGWVYDLHAAHLRVYVVEEDRFLPLEELLQRAPAP